MKTLLSLYLVFAVILSQFFAAYFFSKGRTSYRKAFSALVLCISVYLFGYLMIINNNNLQEMIFWNQIQYLGLPFEVMEDFAERNFGDAEGLTFDERSELYPDHEYPNQEELEVFSSRVMNGLEKVYEKYAGKRVLLVAHGAVIYRILNNLSETKLNLHGRKIENTSISTIYRKDDGCAIQDYNRVDHLEIKQA